MTFTHAKFSIVAGLSLTVALAATPALADELEAASVADTSGSEVAVATQADAGEGDAVASQASDQAVAVQDSTTQASAGSQASASSATIVSEVKNEQAVAVSATTIKDDTAVSPTAVSGDATAAATASDDSSQADDTAAVAEDKTAAKSVSSGDESDAGSTEVTDATDASQVETSADSSTPVEADAEAVTAADGTDSSSSSTTTLTGWQGSDATGWRYYLSDGTYATGEQEVDSNKGDTTQKHWYYFDDTTGYILYGWKWIATSSTLGKWVYYDGTPQTGGLGWRLAGEAYVRQNNEEGSPYGWYYFDEATGAATYGWKYLESGDKWVYYDGTPQTGGTGVMEHGEAHVRRDNNEGSAYGWYYFDDNTGATTYGWKHLDAGDKWVYYDDVGGYMYHGEACLYSGNDEESKAQGEHWYYFDDNTGATTYGWKNMTDGRTVYYIPVMGWMAHGYYNVTDVDTYAVDTDTDRMKSVEESHDRSVTYYFDEVTGNWTVGSAAAWNAYNRISSVGSPTNYIICVDITNFRTVIFQGSAFNWTPIFDWLCGVGNPNDSRNHSGGTYTGTYSLGSTAMLAHPRHFDDGNHYWFVGMWEGFGFHSTLDGEGSDEDQLGKEISLACLRLHYGNAKWLYKHVPDGTPVYIYR